MKGESVSFLDNTYKILMNRLISVIIPVYNTKKYVAKAVKSVMKQTYSNLEIILIDDKSTDSSGNILDELALQDDRIRVYHSECNMGHSLARNKALDMAKGDYYSFVDSDDYISPYYCERLLSLITENDAEIAVCKVKSFFDGDNEPELNDPSDMHIKIENNQEYTDHFLDPFTGPISWCCNKLYKAELFKETRFKPYFGEDIVINAEISLKINTVVWTEDILYAYRLRKDSTTGAGTKNISFKAAKTCLATRDILTANNKQFNRKLAAYTLGKLANLYANCNNKFGKASAKETFILFAHEYDIQKNKKQYGIKNYIKLYIARYIPALYCRLAKNNLPSHK